MLSIPQSTAYVVVFKAYLASDHVTEATGKTIAITISKNGGAFGNPNVGALNATEISSGWYKFTLDTTDTGTIGPVAYRGAVATIDDVGGWLNVVSATTGGATNLDAAISTRLATAGYTAPLDAAGTRTAVGLASANLDTQLSTIDDFLDTEIAAIKAKTDSLTFTKANELDTNIKSVAGTTVTGNGSAGTPWSP